MFYGGQTEFLHNIPDSFMPRIDHGWKNYSHNDYAHSMPNHHPRSSPVVNMEDCLSQDCRRSPIKGGVMIGGEMFSVDHLTESDLASLTRSQTLQIMSTSSVTNSQLSGRPAHIQVYDRLIRDMRIKRMAQPTSHGPKNSLPPLPKRPVRKKWGLSAPYSSTFQEDAELERRERRERVGETRSNLGIETHPATLNVLKFRSSTLKRSESDPQPRSISEAAQWCESPSPGWGLKASPHQLLFRPYKSWGSGFRAPSKNEFYEEEVKRQEALTAILRIPSSQPTQPGVRTPAPSVEQPEAAPPVSAKRVDAFMHHDQKKYITFCHSVPGASLKKSTQILQDSQSETSDLDLSVQSYRLNPEKRTSLRDG